MWGAQLVVINDPEENDFLKNQLEEDMSLWIGLYSECCLDNAFNQPSFTPPQMNDG